jgi:hypothetical protein
LRIPNAQGWNAPVGVVPVDHLRELVDFDSFWRPALDVAVVRLDLETDHGNLSIGDYARLVREDNQDWERFTSPELTDAEGGVGRHVPPDWWQPETSAVRCLPANLCNVASSPYWVRLPSMVGK